MAGPLKAIREREGSEKAEVIDLVNKQMLAEGELVELYEKSVGEIKSQPVKHLLHMIQLDSRKHMDMCQVAVEIPPGRGTAQDGEERARRGATATHRP